jgi:hypothetical protein
MQITAMAALGPAKTAENAVVVQGGSPATKMMTVSKAMTEAGSAAMGGGSVAKKTVTVETMKKTMMKAIARIMNSPTQLYWTIQRIRTALNFSTVCFRVALRTFQ